MTETSSKANAIDALFARIKHNVAPYRIQTILRLSEKSGDGNVRLYFLGAYDRALLSENEMPPASLHPALENDMDSLLALTQHATVIAPFHYARFITTAFDLENKTISQSVSSIKPLPLTATPLYPANTLIALQQWGAQELLAEYSGSSDSGELMVLSVKNALNEDVTALFSESDLAYQAEEVIHEVLEATIGGWELDEGSEGQVHLHIARGELAISHNAFQTTCVTSQTQINQSILPLRDADNEALKRISPFYINAPITVMYCGEGGAIEDMTAFTVDPSEAGLSRSYLSATDQQAIAALGHALLAMIHPNWEMGEGGAGEFTLELRTGHIALSHTAYFAGHSHREINEVLRIEAIYGFDAQSNRYTAY